jgi:hypothetical protein
MTKPKANPARRGAKPGQGLKRTDELVENVLRLVSKGNSLAKACAANGVSDDSFLVWCDADPDLDRRLLRARTRWAFAKVEYANDVASNRNMVTESVTETDSGKAVTTTTRTADDIQRDKLRADTAIKSAQLVLGQIIKVQGDAANPLKVEQSVNLKGIPLEKLKAAKALLYGNEGAGDTERD